MGRRTIAGLLVGAALLVGATFAPSAGAAPPANFRAGLLSFPQGTPCTDYPTVTKVYGTPVFQANVAGTFRVNLRVVRVTNDRLSYQLTGAARTTTGGSIVAALVNRWVLNTNVLNPGGETYLVFTMQRKIGTVWTTYARETSPCA